MTSQLFERQIFIIFLKKALSTKGLRFSLGEQEAAATAH
jgi:hypothetical protein